jgi:hypothetical protein
MPYIKQEERGALDEWIYKQDPRSWSAGQLNYVITKLVRQWINSPSYSVIAAATGVLENVKQEMYRRLASPYEDAKIAENGDVY